MYVFPYIWLITDAYEEKRENGDVFRDLQKQTINCIHYKGVSNSKKNPLELS